MIFDHFLVVRIHVHYLDDVHDKRWMMNDLLVIIDDEKMHDDHDHLFKKRIIFSLIFEIL